MKVRTAVIPAAGKGTRFYPVTKAVPKELLPLVDTPILHHIVLEAANSGVERIVLITGKGKTSLEDYFDTDHDDPVLNEVEIISIRQGSPRGLGHAVLCSKSVVGDEPFAVLLGDDVIDGMPPATKQLIDVFEKYGGSPVVGLMEVLLEETKKYGIVGGTALEAGTMLLNALVEKPDPSVAPSRLAIPGRYVLTPDIFEILEQSQPTLNGEIQLTDALQALAKKRKFYGHQFTGRRFDAGDKLGYLEANLYFGLKRPDMKDRVRALLDSFVKNKSF